MKKNTSLNNKSSQLSEVLKDNLKKNNAKMNKARLSLISMVILALCKMKSSGFDIEKTHLQALQRIEKLLFLVMIAFVWCYKVGDYLDKNVKLIPIKKHGHKAKSIFKYGLEYLSNILQNPFRLNFQ